MKTTSKTDDSEVYYLTNEKRQFGKEERIKIDCKVLADKLMWFMYVNRQINEWQALKKSADHLQVILGQWAEPWE